LHSSGLRVAVPPEVDILAPGWVGVKNGASGATETPDQAEEVCRRSKNNSNAVMLEAQNVL
jgi:hypothetical protein